MTMFSIVDGVDEIIDRSLDIAHIGKAPHYKHIKSCLKLRSKPDSFDGYEVLSKIYDRLEENFQHSENQVHVSGPSPKNWRFEKVLNMDPKNPSEEKILEKTIAKLASEDWVNQIPTSAGVINSSSDNLRNIDLVHRLKECVYEFIELKIKSNTPLYAAFEITLNGLIYFLSRINYKDQWLEEKPMLAANEIFLQTLAPDIYYSRFKLNWLERELNSGLSKLVSEKIKGTLKVKFEFTEFPRGFALPVEEKELLNALEGRSAVKWAEQ